MGDFLTINLCREEAANVHISIADFCFNQLKSMGKDVVMKKDLELSSTDIENKDLLISLGKYFLFEKDFMVTFNVF
jgi:hypothetical protein